MDDYKYRFTHWLPRQAAYEVLLFSERRNLHRWVAEAIETKHMQGNYEYPRLRSDIVLRTKEEELLAPSAKKLGEHWRKAGEPERAGLYLLLAAISACQQSKYPEGLALSESAANLLEEDEMALAELEVLNSEIYYKQSRFEKGLEACIRAEGMLVGEQQKEAAAVRARASIRRGTILHRLARNEEALEVFKRALETARSSGTAMQEAACLSLIANIYGHTRAQRSEISRLYDEALSIQRAIKDIEGEAATLSNMGVEHGMRGEYEAAKRMHERALEIKCVVGDKYGEALSLNNLANVHDGCGEFVEAIRLHNASLAIKRTIGDMHGEATSLHNIADISSYLGEYNEAMPLYEQALALQRAIGDLQGQASSLNNLGRVKYHLGDTTAVASLDNAVSICEKTGIRDILCMALASRALCYYRSGSKDNALADARSAKDISLEINYPECMIHSLISLALCLEDLGTAERALAQATGINHKPYQFEALLVLSELKQGQGDVEGSRAAIEQAKDIARSLGAHGLLKRAEVFIANPVKV